MSEHGRRSYSSRPSGFIRKAGALVALAAIILARQATIVRAAGSDGESKKTAVQRARSCVLKVECRDGDGGTTSIPTVLSGIALDDDGYVVTVGLRAAKNRTISVKDCSGKRHNAQWIAADEYTGLSLLKLESGVTHAPPMTASLPEVGTAVFVVGNPFGLSHSVSVGVVSGLDRSVSFTGGVGRGLIQFTAPVFPGDGGGLLADEDGRMLGIVSTALNEPSADDSSERRINGIGFAIPAQELRRIVQPLRDGQRVERGYLGLTAEDEVQGGIRIATVLKDSPAQKAGLREADLIQAMDDVPVNDFDDLASLVERLRPGTEISLRVMRGEDEFTVQAVLGERPTATRRMPLPPWPERTDPNILPRRGLWDIDPSRRGPWLDADAAVLGLRTQPVTDGLAKSLGLPSTEGALVSSVTPGSAANRAGLRASDVIVSVNDEPVRSPQQLFEAIRKLEPGAKVQLELVRDGKSKSVEVLVAQSGAESMRWPGVVPWPVESQRGRLEALEERVKMLEKQLTELQRRVESRAPAPAPSEN